MSRQVLLFDIDGTLLSCGKVWIEAYLGAVREAFPGWDLPKVNFGGKTDYWIARTLITAKLGDVEPEVLERLSGQIVDRYIAQVTAQQNDRVLKEVRVLPGVPELLERLSQEKDLSLTVLTGNIRQGAELKLAAAALTPFFDLSLGAFGCDHWERSQLPNFALDRAISRLGRQVQGRELVILGDTVHDMTCGRHLGVKTIGVGTGHPEGREALLAERPDHFCEDFSDAEAVLRAIRS